MATIPVELTSASGNGSSGGGGAPHHGTSSGGGGTGGGAGDAGVTPEGPDTDAGSGAGGEGGGIGDAGAPPGDAGGAPADGGAVPSGPVVDAGCTGETTQEKHNAEWPEHAPGPCPPEDAYSVADAGADLSCTAFKYFGYACTEHADGGHTWTAYFACCT